MNLKQKAAAVVAIAVATVATTTPALAADGWDYSSITSSIDFGSIGTGVLAVAALLGAVYAGIKGARIVLGFLRS